MPASSSSETRSGFMGMFKGKGQVRKDRETRPAPVIGRPQPILDPSSADAAPSHSSSSTSKGKGKAPIETVSPRQSFHNASAQAPAPRARTQPRSRGVYTHNVGRNSDSSGTTIDSQPQSPAEGTTSEHLSNRELKFRDETQRAWEATDIGRKEKRTSYQLTEKERNEKAAFMLEASIKSRDSAWMGRRGMEGSSLY
ncbi:MAG: hypothetical protein Q9212_004430 [Teloschistes hypoglaucus]